MPIRAILFDVGGPIDSEHAREAAFDRAIIAALATERIDVTAEALARASDDAVASFAPSAYRAMIWSLCGHDVAVATRAYRAFAASVLDLPDIEPRPGIAGLLASLHERGLLLGLAANQPHATLERLDAHGIGHYFEHREVSGTHGLRKPDVRLFLRACEDLAVSPTECIMVGDRIDNDIAPSRSLGMHAVRFRCGRHAAQQPRSWDECPRADVTSVPALADALDSIIGAAP